MQVGKLNIDDEQEEEDHHGKNANKIQQEIPS